jgi:pentatricopeptide repeat protein
LLLVGCSSVYDYTVEVQLTPERAAELTASVEHWDALIAEPPAEILEEYDGKPDPDYFIEKARAQEYLGQIGAAIRTLESSFDYFEVNSVAWNNLAYLYAQAGEYDKAVQTFQKIIDNFNRYEYYLQISKVYLQAGDLPRARAAYQDFVEQDGSTDPVLAERLGL